MTDRPSARMKKRLNLLFIIPFGVMAVYIIYSVLKVSVLEGGYWKALANSQQLQSTVVSASRGTIYDATGSVLEEELSMMPPVRCWHRAQRCITFIATL